MDNADLGKLTVAPGRLTPPFKKTVTEYDVTLASNEEKIKFTTLTDDSGASYSFKVS